jgi:IS1 family transposase
MSIVQVDDTFVGGKAKNRHKDKRGGGDGTDGIGSGELAVIGALVRKGSVVAKMISGVDAKTLTAFVRESVSEKASLICTDQWVGYKHLTKEFPHGVVNHAPRQYAVGAIHTQTIEGFWSILKRDISGSFHKLRKKYIPLYIAEFEFRYNNRMNADIFTEAIRRC